MQFIKINNVIINMDQVLRIDDAGDSILLRLVRSDDWDHGTNLKLAGPELDAFRQWLKDHGEVRDILHPPSRKLQAHGWKGEA